MGPRSPLGFPTITLTTGEMRTDSFLRAKGGPPSTHCHAPNPPSIYSAKPGPQRLAGSQQVVSGAVPGESGLFLASQGARLGLEPELLCRGSTCPQTPLCSGRKGLPLTTELAGSTLNARICP